MVPKHTYRDPPEIIQARRYNYLYCKNEIQNNVQDKRVTTLYDKTVNCEQVSFD